MHRFYHICHSFPSVSQANSHSSPRHVSPKTYRYDPFAPNPLQTTPFPSCPKKQGCLLCDRVYELPLMKCLLIVSNKLLSITFFQVVVTAKHDSFTFPPGISDSPISQTGICPLLFFRQIQHYMLWHFNHSTITVYIISYF